ncbi:MAG: GrpB family protein [Planctomycetota bacterium]|nr:GrpB family protein [Planctomycetota bacterium]
MDEILVAPYDPHWPELFRSLALPLRVALGPVALRIDHIGSTSVPGLAAKPVIDLQVSVATLEPTTPFRLPLERLGWRFRADNDDLTKRYFREPSGSRRTHLHVRRAGSFSEQSALLLRDFLRATPSRAAAYATLKHSLASLHAHDRSAYTEAKSPFIWETLHLADRWAQSTGWTPGPPDA